MGLLGTNKGLIVFVSSFWLDQVDLGVVCLLHAGLLLFSPLKYTSQLVYVLHIQIFGLSVYEPLKVCSLVCA